MDFSSRKSRFVLVFTVAFLGAAAVALVSWTFTPVSYFEVSMRSSADGLAQIFYDVGRGFNEADSIRVPLQGANKTVEYRVPLPQAKFRAFRFDPLDHGNASIAVDYIRIADPLGRPLRNFSPSDVVDKHDISRIDVVDGRMNLAIGATENDPGLTISFSSPLDLTSGAARRLSVMRAFLVCFTALFATGFLVSLFAPRLQRIAGLFCLQMWAWSRQHPRQALLLIASISVVISCYPVVFFGKTFATANNAAMLYSGPLVVPGATDTESEDFKGSDSGAMVWQNLPYSFVESRGLGRYGELPLWNRFNSCGTPLLAQGLTMSGDPLQVLPLLAGGASWAWDIKFLVAKILFCWGLGLIVLGSCRHVPAALLLCGSSAFIGFFSFRFDHPAYFSMCYAPWILLGWIEVARASTRRSVIAWVMVIFIASWAELNSGSAKESSMLLGTLHGCGFLVLVFGSKNRLAKLVDLAFGALAFVLISSPVWLTFWEALKESYVPYKDASNVFQIQPGLLAGLFDEIFYRAVNPGHAMFNPSANFFILLGCLLALVYVRELMRAPIFLAIGLSALMCFALIFGVIPPGFIQRIPMLKNIWHVDNTFSCPLIIELVVIAGFGVGAWWKHCLRKNWKRDLVLLTMALYAVMGAYLGFTDAAQRGPDDFSPLGATVPWDAFFRVYAWSLIGATLCFPWVVGLMLRRRQLSLVAAGIACACLVMLHWRHGLQSRTHLALIDDYVVNPSKRIDLKVPSPAIEFLKKEPGPFRVVGIGDVFFPGYPMIADLESIHGTDPLMNPYYRELLQGAGVRLEWSWRWIVDKSTLAPPPPIYNLLNIAYFLESPQDPPAPMGSLVKVASLDLDVYKNDKAWPRAFFIDQVKTYDTVGQLLDMIRETPDQPFAALQKGDGFVAKWQAISKPANPNHTIPAHRYRLTNNTTTFAVEAPGPGVVVLTETYLAGDLVAQVNGARSEYFRVNHAFRGVLIPAAGSYMVSFSYWPRHFTRSLWMTAVGTLALLGWLTLRWRKGSPSESEAAIDK